MIRTQFLFTFWLTAHLAFGQLVLTEPYYSRVVVPDHLTCRIEAESVQIDTLIMEKASTLQFTFAKTRMKVAYAIIGKHCLWDASGAEFGGRGKDLDLFIGFEKLGRLTIDTRGGTGMTGAKGKPGSAGMSGTNYGSSAGDGGPGGPGDPGGPGGDGGYLTLVYRAAFSPVFKVARKNSLVLKCSGGDGGRGGPGGEGGLGGAPVNRQYEGATGRVRETNGVWGAKGPTGPVGYQGKKGADGIVKIERVP